MNPIPPQPVSNSSGRRTNGSAWDSQPVTLTADVAVLGSGFSGSLTALILRRLGLKPVVIDRATHPRFAIGESSTPIANRVLRDLAERHDLLRLVPLCKYGEWQQHYPRIVTGLKRGFSYFHHRPQAPFLPDVEHTNELLVTASLNDEHSDTHWLRADVDSFLASEVRRADIPFFERTVISAIVASPVENTALSSTEPAWRITAQQSDQPLRFDVSFIVDATGEGGALPAALSIPSEPSSLRTRSRALFSHFRDLRPWHHWLAKQSAAIGDHPFCCDHAAQHHLLDGAWMWVLRFNNGVTSAGLAIDESRHPLPSDQSPEQEWAAWLARYPSLAELFQSAEIVSPPGGLIRTKRIQRRLTQCVGNNWAALPHTAGFIDPLHSTGIAHTLCGIERLTDILASHWQCNTLASTLENYEQATFAELTLIDTLVAACYESLQCFPLFVAASMLYFAAATTYERRRAATGFMRGHWFLCADDSRFFEFVVTWSSRISRVAQTNPDWHTISGLIKELKSAIEPFNQVGLFDSSAKNMYRYTAAPE